VAGLLAGLLARSGARGRKLFLGIAAAVFIVMIFPSATIGAPTSMVWMLEIMHGAVAVPVVMSIDKVFTGA
jgi:nitrate reductase NapE component